MTFEPIEYTPSNHSLTNFIPGSKYMILAIIFVIASISIGSRNEATLVAINILTSIRRVSWER